MKVLRHSFIDWEPLQVLVRFKSSSSNWRPYIEKILEEVFSLRRTKNLCSCSVKSLDIESSPRSEKVTVICEWMCNRCLEMFLDFLRHQLLEIEQVEIGVPLLNNVRSEFPNINRSPFVDIGPKVVEFENGTMHRVKAFSIARWPVSIGEFAHFEKMTGYITQAEKNGQDTFRDNPAMAAFGPVIKKLKPAMCVSYYDAEAYCQWAGMRLPTEAEWLAAAVYEDTIYDEIKDQDKYMDAQGRLAGKYLNHPDKLEELADEWTLADNSAEEAIVRTGPCHFRFTDWKVHPARKVAPKNVYDIMLGFRVVRDAKTGEAAKT